MTVITRYPTSDTAVSGTWTNPTYVQAADTTNLAVVTVAAKNTTYERQQGTYGFDAAIPVGATINSVQIEVGHLVSSTAGIAYLENLAYLGATAGAVNSDSLEPTTLTARSYSTYARPGGGSWTRNDLLNATFKTGIRARSGNNATSVNYSWDYIRVTVDYTSAPTPKAVSTTVTVTPTVSRVASHLRALSQTITATPSRAVSGLRSFAKTVTVTPSAVATKVSAGATPTFMSAGGSETAGTQLFTNVVGSVAYDSTVRDGTTAGGVFKFDTTATPADSSIRATGCLSDAGSRITFRYRFETAPASDTPSVANLLQLMTAPGGDLAFFVTLDTARHLGMSRSSSGTPAVTGTTVVPTGQFVTITLAYKITSTTVNEFRLYLDTGSGSALECTLTNTTLFYTGTNRAIFGLMTASAWGTSHIAYVSSIYIDDATDYSNPGNVRVTAKRPASLGAENQFSTLGGSGTNRWDRVADRPLNVANYVRHGVAETKRENFGIQSAATGDLDISGATYKGFMGWLDAEGSTAGSAYLTLNGSDYAISLQSYEATFRKAVASTSYPSASGTIGMVSAPTVTTNTLYECGVLVAYIPASGTQTPKSASVTLTVTPSRAGIKQAARALLQVVTVTPSKVRQAGKVLLRTVTVTPSRVRAVSRAFAKVLTVTPSRVKQAGRKFAQTVTVTPSMSKLKAKAKALLVTLTATPTRVRQAQRKFTRIVTVTPTRAIQARRALLKTVTVTPSKARTVARSFARVVTVTASKIANKIAGGGTTTPKSVLVTLTVTPTKVRQARKALLKAVTVTPTAVKQARRLLALTVTVTPLKARAVARKFARVVTVTPSVLKSKAKLKALVKVLTVTPSATKTKVKIKALLKTLTVTPLRGPRAIVRKVAYTASVTPKAARAISAARAVTVTVAPLVGRAISKAFARVVSVVASALAEFRPYVPGLTSTPVATVVEVARPTAAVTQDAAPTATVVEAAVPQGRIDLL